MTATPIANETSTGMQPGDKKPFKIFLVLPGQGIPNLLKRGLKDFKTLTEGLPHN